MSYMKQLVNQIRALDMYGTWEKLSDEALISQKYVKSKDELRDIPTIADIDEAKIKELKILYNALALAFEVNTGVMATVVMEMSHEGFGRCVVIAEKIVIAEKYFKDAHRFFFPSLEKLHDEMEKTLTKALEIYKMYHH